jgi:hypothetical protein
MSVDVGVSRQPLLTAQDKNNLLEQFEDFRAADSFDEALGQAVFTAASLVLLDNYGQLQRDMSEYNNG